MTFCELRPESELRDKLQIKEAERARAEAQLFRLDLPQPGH
jgi:hypothetical protein